MLDSIIILSMGLIIFISYKQGFIKAAYGLCSSIVSLAIAFVIYPIMTGILKLTPIYTRMKEWNYQAVSSLEVVSGLQAQADLINEATSWLPRFIGESLVKNNNPEVYKMMEVSNIAEYVSSYITDIGIRALAIAITWLIVKIALSLCIGTLDIIAKLPVISTFNKAGGLTLGGIKALFMVWMFFLITPFISILPSFARLQTMVDKSIIGKFLYNNNLILDYLQNLFL